LQVSCCSLEVYPNPVDNIAVIRYFIPTANCQLSTANPAEIEIYDLRGVEIKTLVSSYQEPGEHELSWDASGLELGIYILRMQLGNTIISNKMIKL
jgi:hypothetical protein